MPRVLFINPNYEDYLADGVFHGLRTLLGSDAVDFPKAEHLYDTATPSVLGAVRGGFGFTLYGLLPDLPIERNRLLRRVVDREFDLVVFGDIWRTFGLWTEWAPQLKRAGIPMAVLDGADGAAPYPFGHRWWRERAWWFLPRAHNRATYFKRELTPRTRWLASYLILPPTIGRRLGLRPISFCIPVEKIVDAAPPKEKDFPRHIVDAEVAARLGTDMTYASRTGGRSRYAFRTEADYYEDLRRSRFGITTRRAGWDAIRHYEIAANGAVPCFRNLDRKPASCAPHGLDESNCVIYADAGDLFAKLEAIGEDRYSQLQEGALAWARASTTVIRACELLTVCGLEIDGSNPAESQLSN